MFNAHARGEPKGDLLTGIDALTLMRVMKLLADPTVRHTAETVAQALTISRTTSRRSGILRESAPDCRRDYSWQVGRPQRIYHGGCPGEDAGRCFPRPGLPAISRRNGRGARHHNFRGDTTINRPTTPGTDALLTTQR